MLRSRTMRVLAPSRQNTAAAVVGVGTAALCTAARSYTPIATPDAAVDYLGALRTDDECRTLWAQHVPVPSVARGIELWLRFGNDPVVDAAAPLSVPAIGASAPASTSPFAYAEDYMGSNLVTGSAAHVKESAELWSDYFETKYVRRMRQSRRTSRQYVGVMSAQRGNNSSRSNAAAAPSSSALADLFSDEADHPNTKWEKDTFFREVAYLSERHLKVKVTNYLQLESLLWGGTAEEEAFVHFFDAFQQQTVTRIPLPVPSIWAYDTPEAKKAWVKQYLPVCTAAHAFFQEKLKPLSADATAQKKLLADVAAAYKQVHAVLLERWERQQKTGICPAASAWTSGLHRRATAEEEAWVTNEVEKEQRRIEEGVFDPEDILDTTPEWTAEHAKIEELLHKKVTEASYNFTLQEFWQHTERREALETAHVLEMPSLTHVAAAARRRLFGENTLAEIYAGLEESVARGRLDLRAAVLTPHFNAVWCRWHYVKFGASSLVQHTHTASRQLLFHYAASMHEVAATAELYFATKPLSSLLDYASPYTFRRSLARLCARYGVEMAHAAQQPLLVSAAHLAQAEGVVGRVAAEAARPFGVRRRARYAAAQANHQRLLSPVQQVTVTAPTEELLEAGADLRAVLRDEASRKTKASAETVKVWPLGSYQVVSYKWTTPTVDKLRLLNLTDRSLTAEQAVQRDTLRAKGRAEVSLWRRRTPEERQKVQAMATAEAAEVQALAKSTPALAEVTTYAKQLYAQLTREQQQRQADSTTASASPPSAEKPKDDKNAGEGDEWVFAVMLNDNVPLSETQSAEVFLPYVDAAGNKLPNGEYRAVVRGVDLELNPTEHPTLTSEGASASFSVVDALPQLYAQYTNKQQKAGDEAPLEGDMPGAELIPFCSFLRDAGLHVPLSAEFAVGQSLSKEGTFTVEELADSLRGTQHHHSQSEVGVTDAQRAIEPACRMHWTLYRPGANDGEWAAARRRVLRLAMEEERDWWLADPILDVVDVRTGSSSAPSVNFAAYPAAARYGTELCAVLPAHGTNRMDYAVLPSAPGVKGTTADGRQRIQADCTVDGTGALTSLHYGAPISDAGVTVEDALAAALEAIQVAQMRHSTLSMVKRSAFAKLAQTAVFCGVHGLQFGGKYARTYAYALDKAKAELAATAAAGYVASVLEADTQHARVSEQQSPSSSSVDRFASQINPEQRRTRFAPRAKLDSYSMEDPAPSQTSSWGH